MKTYTVIPVKRLSDSKTRLSSILNSQERRMFSLCMLKDVLRATEDAKTLNQTVIVSSDNSVSEIAYDHDAIFLEETQQNGLNAAVRKATDWCVGEGAESVLTVPADIPLVLADDLEKMAFVCRSVPSIVITPSYNGSGTNALLRSPPNIILSNYGPDSFRRHIRSAISKQLAIYVYDSERIALDIDSVEDLIIFLKQRTEESQAYRFLRKIGMDKRLRLSWSSTTQASF